VKDETANEKALVQAMDYVRAAQQQNPGKEVKGAIVCPDATPRRNHRSTSLPSQGAANLGIGSSRRGKI